MENIITIRVEVPGLLEALALLTRKTPAPIPAAVPAPMIQVQSPAAPEQIPVIVPVVQPYQPPAQPAAQLASVPTTEHTYTMEQLAVAATPIADSGRRQELVNLLTSYGVQALTQLPKEQYGAFATALRGLGAKL